MPDDLFKKSPKFGCSLLTIFKPTQKKAYFALYLISKINVFHYFLT